MKCIYCKGTMIDDITTDVTDLSTCIIIIRSVPCHKCIQCGEVAFDFEICERVEQLVESLEKSLTEIAVIQYSSIAA